MRQTHEGEGGEQGDALVPLLFSLGQHSALEAAPEELAEGRETLLFHCLQEHPWIHARTHIHGGEHPSSRGWV